MDIGVAEIRRWHTDPPPKGNGWNDIGYLGNLSIYHVKLDSGKMVTATQANMARLIDLKNRKLAGA